MSNFDLALSIMLGVGLAAATGFRLFLPMLIVSGAAYTGHLPLAESFGWLGTPAALTMLGVAALVEILGSGLPACSPTMYSAYQSGQFSSRWPPSASRARHGPPPRVAARPRARSTT